MGLEGKQERKHDRVVQTFCQGAHPPLHSLLCFQACCLQILWLMEKLSWALLPACLMRWDHIG